MRSPLQAGFQPLSARLPTTWACAREARFSPGNIRAGFQPENAAGVVAHLGTQASERVEERGLPAVRVAGEDGHEGPSAECRSRSGRGHGSVLRLLTGSRVCGEILAQFRSDRLQLLGCFQRAWKTQWQVTTVGFTVNLNHRGTAQKLSDRPLCAPLVRIGWQATQVRKRLAHECPFDRLHHLLS